MDTHRSRIWLGCVKFPNSPAARGRDGSGGTHVLLAVVSRVYVDMTVV